jgi:hypothetical protein
MQPLYLRGRNTWYPWIRVLDVLQSRSGVFGEQKDWTAGFHIA